ncbi:TetR/AcrR family transcriptional regulator [Nocardioides sp. cx-169]|uniref:TetR family transcriptional regulator n=1 Tax=Nocardioides sp. cx-169 TaxID=2899080 RepID=UPI001E5D2318|nr:TetR family transcriptional regulator [Nocardioides sp. cx-169]MCD4533658.1 TetR/AcrR family transcriptional regulator [Nocardioides sp. cx-169]
MTESRTTRTIAREAVRADLSQAAFQLTRQRGFDNITVGDMAAAAGVSRSTLLRYFASKEEAVLYAFSVHVARFAEALRARPDSEDDWTVLRRSLEGVIDFYLADPVGALEITQLVIETPELYAHQLQRQHSWRPVLAEALAARAGLSVPVPIALEVKVGAALSCLSIAVERWVASAGALDLLTLLREGLDVIAPTPASVSSVIEA